MRPLCCTRTAASARSVWNILYWLGRRFCLLHLFLYFLIIRFSVRESQKRIPEHKECSECVYDFIAAVFFQWLLLDANAQGIVFMCICFICLCVCACRWWYVNFNGVRPKFSNFPTVSQDQYQSVYIRKGEKIYVKHSSFIMCLISQGLCNAIKKKRMEN